ncbi:MAG: TrkA family potassium uptake protein [Lachnospiraceae bacterium]|nr:TrkA family potassium uptake protein [Lachnospiraceae bacterium]
MDKNKSYAVFGLGRYGKAVAKELAAAGADVLAVDIDENIVNAAASEIPFCKCADVTDPDVIRRLGIADIDVVVIAMAAGLETSVMATMLCKEAGVGKVIAKCSSEINCRILSRVGADVVVVPEYESGVRLARNLMSSGIMEYIELSDDFSMVEVHVDDKWKGKNLIELDLRRKYSINVVATIKGDDVCVNPDPEKPLEDGMRLIVIGKIDAIEKLR